MNHIQERDVVEFSKQIETSSVDCILADPPYNIGKNFGTSSDNLTPAQYTKWCKQWIVEFERILSPSGTGFIYGFDEILAHISVQISLSHRWLTWYYTNKNTSGTNFWQRSHESIIVFWKDSKRRIFNEEETREPYTETFLKNSAGKTRKGTIGRLSKKDMSTVYNANELGARGRDVIKVAALAGGAGAKERIYFCNDCQQVFMGNKQKHSTHTIVEHPTQKPQQLTEKLLKSCLPKSNGKFGGTVYIPFAGSGAECLCCQRLDITFLATDNNPEYVKHGNMLLTNHLK